MKNNLQEESRKVISFFAIIPDAQSLDAMKVKWGEKSTVWRRRNFGVPTYIVTHVRTCTAGSFHKNTQTYVRHATCRI